VYLNQYRILIIISYFKFRIMCHSKLSQENNMRPSGRQPDELRPIQFTRYYTKHAEGSVLVEFGDTRLICNASISTQVPPFLRDKSQGWVTAEYGMLPRSTGTRMNREATRGGQGGRTMEIQRLIGRSLRASVDLTKLGEHTITVDCDVIQADGGTRTAAISGGYVALVDALTMLLSSEVLRDNPIRSPVASISVGLHQNIPILDLDYAEDSAAQTDMNVVMNERGEFIEVQGTAESQPFSQRDLAAMLELARAGIEKIIQAQRLCLR